MGTCWGTCADSQRSRPAPMEACRRPAYEVLPCCGAASHPAGGGWPRHPVRLEQDDQQDDDDDEGANPDVHVGAATPAIGKARHALALLVAVRARPRRVAPDPLAVALGRCGGRSLGRSRAPRRRGPGRGRSRPALRRVRGCGRCRRRRTPGSRRPPASPPAGSARRSVDRRRHRCRGEDPGHCEHRDWMDRHAPLTLGHGPTSWLYG